MIKKLLQNCRKPMGIAGRMLVQGMNRGHADVSQWGLSHLTLSSTDHVLDVGCGGGANIKSLLALCPQGKVYGIDYSAESVAVSRKTNAAELGNRCEIQQGSVSGMPYADNAFDVVTAFETVYFWPDIVADFIEVRRVLKSGGVFMICNEMSDPADTIWSNKIEGMRIYSDAELEQFLKQAGFTIQTNDTQGKKRMCLIACKE